MLVLPGARRLVLGKRDVVKTRNVLRGLLNRLSAPLSGLFEDERPRPRAAAPRRRAVAFQDDAIALTLDDLVHEEGGKFTTKLQIVSLVEFREAVAERWPRLADKVLMLAESTIQRHLESGQHFTRQGEDMFVLVFSNLSDLEARARAVIIGNELGLRLLGDSRFVGAAVPLVQVAEIDADAARGPDGHFDLSLLSAAVAEARTQSAEEREAAGLRAHMKPGEGGAAADAALRWHLKPGEGGPADSGPEELRRHLLPGQAVAAAGEPGLRRHLLPSAAPPPPAESAPPPPPPAPAIAAVDPTDPDLSVVWRPTWCDTGEIIAAFQAVPVRAGAAKGAAAYAGLDAAASLASDRTVVAEAVTAMEQGAQAGNKVAVILPLRFSTLDRAGLAGVVAALGAVPEPLRLMRLVVELWDVPPGAKLSVIAPVLSVLRPLCREIALRVPARPERVAQLAGLRANLVACDLAGLTAAERTDEALAAQLGPLRAAAETVQMRPCLWGVRSRPILVQAVWGGYAMVNGSALIKEVPRPGRPIPAPRSRFV